MLAGVRHYAARTHLAASTKGSEIILTVNSLVAFIFAQLSFLDLEVADERIVINLLREHCAVAAHPIVKNRKITVNIVVVEHDVRLQSVRLTGRLMTTCVEVREGSEVAYTLCINTRDEADRAGNYSANH